MTLTRKSAGGRDIAQLLLGHLGRSARRNRLRESASPALRTRNRHGWSWRQKARPPRWDWKTRTAENRLSRR